MKASSSFGRAVVVEPGTLARHGLAGLATDAGLDCVAALPTAAAGLQAARRNDARLAVVGGCLDMRPLDAVSRFAADGVAPVVVAAVTDLLAAYHLYQAGALGVLAPSAAESEFRAMFEAAAAGRRFVAPNLLADAIDRPPPRPHVGGLTPREHEVLGALAEGRTNMQIAEQLCIGVETVKTHLASI